MNDGRRYDPATDTWRSLPTANAPSARGGHTAVWTWEEMIVWGGYGRGPLGDGARYRLEPQRPLTMLYLPAVLGGP